MHIYSCLWNNIYASTLPELSVHIYTTVHCICTITKTESEAAPVPGEIVINWSFIASFYRYNMPMHVSLSLAIMCDIFAYLKVA